MKNPLYLALAAFLLIALPSCEKITTMIKDEFNSERTPAIPNQTSTTEVETPQESER